MSDTAFIILAVVALLLVVFTVTLVATKGGTNLAWQKEAVKEGHAEYYLDAKHERRWRWLPAPEKGEPDEQD